MPQRLFPDEAPFPVMALFNRLNATEFERMLRAFAEGRGFNPEDMVCAFPAEQAEDDGQTLAAHGTIEFWHYAGNETVNLPFPEFMRVLKRAVAREATARPRADATLRVLVQTIDDRVAALANAHAAFLAASGRAVDE